MTKTIKIITTMCLVLFLFASAVLAAPGKTVRVGYYMFDGYQMEDSNHVRSGYGYEFLQEVGRYTGWNFEYVGYDLGWSKLQQMLDDGDIDVLTSARMTPSRAGNYLFSDPMGTSAGILTVKSGNHAITMDNYATYNNLRVGMIADSSINENFTGFAATKGFTFTPVYYSNADEMYAALQDGKDIDAACTTNLRRIKNEWILDQFDNDNFYAMMKLGRTDLQQGFNDAIRQMDIYSPGWRVALWNKYYAPYMDGDISLTTAEKEFISNTLASKRIFTVLVNPDNEPYSYFEKGTAKGIIPTVFSKIAERTGLKFEILVVKDREAYQAAKKNGQADIIIDQGFFYDAAEKLGYKLTVPYLTTSVALVSCGEKHPFHRIALLDSGWDFDAQHPELIQNSVIPQYYPNMTACLDAVSEDTADFTYTLPYAAQFYRNNHANININITLIPPYSYSLALAVANREDYRLLLILNKAVASIKDNYVNEVILEQLSTKQPAVSASAFFTQHPYAKTILGVLLLALLLAIGLNIYIRRNQQLLEEKNKQLEGAMQKVTEAVETRSMFLSSISHDMRTPLNGILGFTDFALHTDDKKKLQDYLQKIDLSGRLLLNLINDTLALSRIESGKVSLKLEAVHSSELLESIVAGVRATALSKKVDFIASFGSDFPEYIQVDKLKVQEICLNLLSNAVKFTPKEGEVRFTVSWLNPPQGAMTTKIVVADTGVGISKDFLPHLYEAFAQENAHTTEYMVGTGLGLSIVKRYVEKMEGHITVTSIKGQGTTFTILLPFPVASACPVSTKPVEKKADIRGLRVLLFEDNYLNQEIATTLLQGHGALVTTANNGQDGLDIFTKAAPGTFDIILMDLRMPVLDGFGAAIAIRALQRPDAAIPILAMTADAYQEDVDKCLALGMNGHVAKPIEPQKLFAAMIAAVKKV